MRKILILSPFIVLFLILIPFLLLRGKGVFTPTKFFPTPTPVDSAYSVNTFAQNLTITKTVPENNQKQISLNQKIIIYLSKKVSLNDIKFFITPTIKFNSALEGNNIVITPQSSFDPGTTYAFSLDYKLHPIEGTFEFTTTGPTSTLEHDTTVDVKQIRDDWNLVNHPDLYLSDQVPYETGSFSITSDYAPSPTGHFYFEVTVKTSQDQAKSDFVSWVKSFGITDSQINSLDIRGLDFKSPYKKVEGSE